MDRKCSGLRATVPHEGECLWHQICLHGADGDTGDTIMPSVFATVHRIGPMPLHFLRQIQPRPIWVDGANVFHRSQQKNQHTN